MNIYANFVLEVTELQKLGVLSAAKAKKVIASLDEAEADDYYNNGMSISEIVDMQSMLV